MVWLVDISVIGHQSEGDTLLSELELGTYKLMNERRVARFSSFGYWGFYCPRMEE
jgi:hypothetical protein